MSSRVFLEALDVNGCGTRESASIMTEWRALIGVVEKLVEDGPMIALLTAAGAVPRSLLPLDEVVPYTASDVSVTPEPAMKGSKKSAGKVISEKIRRSVSFSTPNKKPAASSEPEPPTFATWLAWVDSFSPDVGSKVIFSALVKLCAALHQILDDSSVAEALPVSPDTARTVQAILQTVICDLPVLSFPPLFLCMNMGAPAESYTADLLLQTNQVHGAIDDFFACKVVAPTVITDPRAGVAGQSSQLLASESSPKVESQIKEEADGGERSEAILGLQVRMLDGLNWDDADSQTPAKPGSSPTNRAVPPPTGGAGQSSTMFNPYKGSGYLRFASVPPNPADLPGGTLLFGSGASSKKFPTEWLYARYFLVLAQRCYAAYLDANADAGNAGQPSASNARSRTSRSQSNALKRELKAVVSADGGIAMHLLKRTQALAFYAMSLCSILPTTMRGVEELSGWSAQLCLDCAVMAREPLTMRIAGYALALVVPRLSGVPLLYGLIARIAQSGSEESQALRSLLKTCVVEDSSIPCRLHGSVWAVIEQHFNNLEGTSEAKGGDEASKRGTRLKVTGGGRGGRRGGKGKGNTGPAATKLSDVIAHDGGGMMTRSGRRSPLPEGSMDLPIWGSSSRASSVASGAGVEQALPTKRARQEAGSGGGTSTQQRGSRQAASSKTASKPPMSLDSAALSFYVYLENSAIQAYDKPFTAS